MAVLHWCSRYILSWAVDQTLEDRLRTGCHGARPSAGHTHDLKFLPAQSYYQSAVPLAPTRVTRPHQHGRQGPPPDNIFTEHLWRTIKYEVHLHYYDFLRHARQQLSTYLTFYNYQRLHQSLAQRRPAEVYFAD